MDQNIVNKIILDLSTNPNSTIEQISNRLNQSKPVIKKVIDNLVNDSIVIDSNNYYSLSEVLSNNLFVDRTDIFFNLNLPKDIIANIYALFNIVEKHWINITGKKPSKVQMQKTIVEIAEKFNLNIPMGWYKFGKITPVSYEPVKNYNNYNLSEDLDEKEIVNIITINTNLNPSKITQKQYKSGDTDFHKLYQLKTAILGDIQENKSIDALNKFEQLKTHFIDHADTEIINQYYSFLVYYQRLPENKKDPETKNIYNNLFNCFWDIIAIYNFRKTLGEFYSRNNLEETDINLKLLIQLNINKQRFYELLSDFYESFKITDFYNDPDTQKLIDKVLGS